MAPDSGRGGFPTELDRERSKRDVSPRGKDWRIDEVSIRDRATYEDPRRYSEGTVHVLVNGRFGFRDGKADRESRRPSYPKALNASPAAPEAAISQSSEILKRESTTKVATAIAAVGRSTMARVART